MNFNFPGSQARPLLFCDARTIPALCAFGSSIPAAPLRRFMLDGPWGHCLGLVTFTMHGTWGHLGVAPQRPVLGPVLAVHALLLGTPYTHRREPGSRRHPRAYGHMFGLYWRPGSCHTNPTQLGDAPSLGSPRTAEYFHSRFSLGLRRWAPLSGKPPSDFL